VKRTATACPLESNHEDRNSAQAQIISADPPCMVGVNQRPDSAKNPHFQFLAFVAIYRMAGGGDGVDQGPSSNGLRLPAQKVYDFTVESELRIILDEPLAWNNRCAAKPVGDLDRKESYFNYQGRSGIQPRNVQLNWDYWPACGGWDNFSGSVCCLRASSMA
jgi:hypothetical protein